MATGWNVIDALNKRTTEAMDNKPKARFRTKDISINRIYSNDMNFYSMDGIEKLAQEIFAIGLMDNLVVVNDPCDRGEYRIIAGERRWRALKMLVEQGHEEFEIVSCQIKTPTEEHEERVQLILANGYRDKTVMDVLTEEKQLKETLQYMKDNGLTLQGYKLDSGRLRDVIADIMNMSPTKIAQIESINKRLIPEFTEELKEGRLTLSAAYEISGMSEEAQKEILEKHQDHGVTLKEVREIKERQQEEAKKEEIDGQMTIEEMQEDAEGSQTRQSAPESDETGDGEEWQQAHPESVTSLCYRCQRYSDCNVKTSTCTSCDRYVNKAEAEKTEEQRYNEEQDAIDRQTAKKLREREEEKKAETLPSDSEKKKEEKFLRVSGNKMKEIIDGKPYMIVKGEYKPGDIVVLQVFHEGKHTGEQIKAEVTYTDNENTCAGIGEGYTVMAIKQIIEDMSGFMNAPDGSEYADQPTMQPGA